MALPGYIDFHCHLDDPCYDAERQSLIDRCLSSGLRRLVTVADASSDRSLELTAAMLADHAAIVPVVGAHPHQADQYSLEIERRIFSFLGRFKVLAIGEVGLDFHYDFSTPESQIRVLSRQIAIARECSLPLVIHSRAAESVVLKMLAAEGFDGSVVFHCFTGDQAAADEIIRRGYFISISGIVTFKKAEVLRGIVEGMPLGQLFSETDAPYLAPEPDRGKTNTPLGVIRVVERIAELKRSTVEAVTEQIENNFTRLRS